MSETSSHPSATWDDQMENVLTEGQYFAGKGGKHMWKIESTCLIYVDDDDDKRRRSSEESVGFIELQWDQSHEEVRKNYVLRDLSDTIEEK